MTKIFEGEPQPVMPVVGKIVLYRPAANDPVRNPQDILPALIMKVWSAKNVNLRVFNDGGDDFWVTSVQYGNSPRNWQWPPSG